MRHIIKWIWTSLFVLCVSIPAWATEDVSPKVVVESAVQGIIDVLKNRENPDKLSAKDRDAIRAQVAGRFDYREMARRSVGKPWKKQSEEKKVEFTHVFRDLLEYTYANRLAAYKNQVVEYDKAEFKRNKARVKTRVIDDQKVTPVEYRLHQTDKGWMVYDIKIEGVSLVGTFRKDFKSSLKRKGFDALMEALQKKVEKMKEKASS